MRRKIVSKDRFAETTAYKAVLYIFSICIACRAFFEGILRDTDYVGPQDERLW
jgi:hypothetical protein